MTITAYRNFDLLITRAGDQLPRLRGGRAGRRSQRLLRAALWRRMQ